MAEDIKSIYVTALRNTRALEQQGLQQMERQVGGLESYPDYAALLKRHVTATESHLSRLDAALEMVGESPSALKEAATSVAGTLGAAMHAVAGDETLKNLYAGYAFQHDQIAAYRSLIVIADTAGQPTDGFKTTLSEEQKAAEEVAALIEPVTSAYLKLATSGSKADS